MPPSDGSATASPTSPAARARYRRILRFASITLAQLWWFELALPRIGLRGLAARNRIVRLQRVARRFHVLAAELGGLMIKVGQFLSSRLDVLPPEVTRELEGLQDEVAAEPFDAIRSAAERELGMPLSVAYASFDPVPIAAASLGQAHRARLSPAVAADLRRVGGELLRGLDVSPGVRLLGVSGQQLVRRPDDAADQGTLFPDDSVPPDEAPDAGEPAGSGAAADDGRQAALERSVDAVRARFGTGAVGHGSARSLPGEGPRRPTR